MIYNIKRTFHGSYIKSSDLYKILGVPKHLIEKLHQIDVIEKQFILYSVKIKNYKINYKNESNNIIKKKLVKKFLIELFLVIYSDNIKYHSNIIKNNSIIDDLNYHYKHNIERQVDSLINELYVDYDESFECSCCAIL